MPSRFILHIIPSYVKLTFRINSRIIETFLGCSKFTSRICNCLHNWKHWIVSSETVIFFLFFFLQMYEKALATNQRLKSRLEISKQELAMIQDQLQRAQVHLQSTSQKKVVLIILNNHFTYTCNLLIRCHKICFPLIRVYYSNCVQLRY